MISPETRMMGLPYGEEIIIVVTVHECDRQTDTQTDGQTDRITITKTVHRIASHGKNDADSTPVCLDVVQMTPKRNT